ncbi:5552_t:CDS:2, partial [Racocetra persica]
VTLIQAILISYFPNDTSIIPEDLSYSFSLMIYSAAAVTNSFQSNDEVGRHSFMMFRRLYNRVTSKKNIESNVINYVSNINESQTSSSSNKGKEKLCDKLDNQLDLIEEKYAKMDTQSSKKRKLNNYIPKPKPQKDESSSTNFTDTISQIKTGEPPVQENSDDTVNSQDIDSD